MRRCLDSVSPGEGTAVKALSQQRETGGAPGGLCGAAGKAATNNQDDTGSLD